jgi:chromosomal replication initiation ATPase DnaA
VTCRPEELFRSRFEWESIADIYHRIWRPRIAILQKKAENDPFNLPVEVAEYIAHEPGVLTSV